MSEPEAEPAGVALARRRLQERACALENDDIGGRLLG